VSQYYDGNTRGFTCDEALAIHRCVKMDADGKITYAGAADVYHGTVEAATAAAGDLVSVRLRSASGTRKMVVASSTLAGAFLFQAASGKVDDSGDYVVGVGLEAGSGDGAIIEVLPLEIGNVLVPTAAAQSLSGAGAANVTAFLTKWTTTGVEALTLANGVRPGQLKKIQMIVDGGNGTLTPTSLSGGTTIVFADAGDFALLKWNGAAWVALELGNDTDGATAPALA